MKNVIAGALLAVSLVVSGGAQAASYIQEFKKTTNDGVFSLTAEQADFFGVSTDDHIGFFRVREGNGVSFDAGDTFDVSTMLNSLMSGAGSVIKFLNGTNGALGYSGDAYDDLGTTTLGDENSYYRGVAFLFSGTGNIVFNGSSTFNSGQSTGDLDFTPPAAVPLPAGLPLLLTALGGVALIARRRKAA